MQATTDTASSQQVHMHTSMWNTHSRRWTQVIERRRSWTRDRASALPSRPHCPPVDCRSPIASAARAGWRWRQRCRGSGPDMRALARNDYDHVSDLSRALVGARRQGSLGPATRPGELQRGCMSAVAPSNTATSGCHSCRSHMYLVFERTVLAAAARNNRQAVRAAVRVRASPDRLRRSRSRQRTTRRPDST